MYQIDRERTTGTGPLSPADMAIADRYAEGQNFRARYGAIAPLLAALGAAGYEGVVKPAMERVPALGKLAPASFRPGEETAKSGGEDALLRALAMVYGAMTSR
jgi:hypothetical protein